MTSLLITGAEWLVHAAHAEDAVPNPSDEAAQFNKEETEAKEAAGNVSLLSDFTGKFTLFTKDEIEAGGDATVIGKFEIESETHLVKPMNDLIKGQLIEKNGKICSLHAKIRNNGKYIFVEKIVTSGSPNAFTGRRGGLR